MHSLRSSFVFWSLIGGILGLLATSAAPKLTAQQTEQKPVTFDVTVTDRPGKPIQDLTKEEFSVHENGVKQTIESFTNQKVPFSLGLVVDSSGSIRERLPIVRDTALRAISHLSKDDEACLVRFNMEAELLEAFTNDYQKLSQELTLLQPRGGTSLFDAIYVTTHYAEQNGKHRRKALLVITDGLEKNSVYKENQIRTLLMENHVQVYFIYLPPPPNQNSSLFINSTTLQGRELLSQLAEISGGQAFFPKKPDEAPDFAEQVIETLRHQYQISYLPTEQNQDGKWRKVKVGVSPKTDRQLAVTTRPGYFAPGHVTEREKEERKKAEKQRKKKP